MFLCPANHVRTPGQSTHQRPTGSPGRRTHPKEPGGSLPGPGGADDRSLPLVGLPAMVSVSGYPWVEPNTGAHDLHGLAEGTCGCWLAGWLRFPSAWGPSTIAYIPRWATSSKSNPYRPRSPLVQRAIGLLESELSWLIESGNAGRRTDAAGNLAALHEQNPDQSLRAIHPQQESVIPLELH